MIFYFSGTGNTKWAVEKLAEKTGDEVEFYQTLPTSQTT